MSEEPKALGEKQGYAISELSQVFQTLSSMTWKVFSLPEAQAS